MAFTEALRPERTPGLELLATVISLPDPAGATLALERVAATAATWSEGGVPLYVYRRGRALAKAEARASKPFGFSAADGFDTRVGVMTSSISANFQRILPEFSEVQKNIESQLEILAKKEIAGPLFEIACFSSRGSPETSDSGGGDARGPGHARPPHRGREERGVPPQEAEFFFLSTLLGGRRSRGTMCS